MNTPRIVRCPQCGKSSEFSTRNPFRPFCSQRCRTNDLGAWASGEYTVPAEPSELTPEELETLMGEGSQDLPPADEPKKR